MSNKKRGRITVQHQPSGAARGMQRMMGVVHAVFGFVFVVLSITQIIPHAGLIGIVFLAVGLFFLINGIRLAVSKNGMAHRVGYEVETDLDKSIVGLMEEVVEEQEDTDATAEERLIRARNLYEQGLITQEEYEAKRQEIIRDL